MDQINITLSLREASLVESALRALTSGTSNFSELDSVIHNLQAASKAAYDSQDADLGDNFQPESPEDRYLDSSWEDRHEMQEYGFWSRPAKAGFFYAQKSESSKK